MAFYFSLSKELPILALSNEQYEKTYKILFIGTSVSLLDRITDMLFQLEISASGCASIVGFELTLKPEKDLLTVQHDIIKSYIDFIDTTKCIKFVVKERNFDFEDYMNTDIDGVGQSAGMDHALCNLDATIDRVLRGETTEFKQQARKAVATLWRDQIENWLADGGC